MKMLKLLLISFVAFLCVTKVSSHISNDNPPSGRYGGIDISRLDSLLSEYYHTQTLKINDTLSPDFIYLTEQQLEQEDGLSLDSIYKLRLGMMSSIIQIPYNHIVREQIDRYVKYKRTTGNTFGLSMRYFPLFEEELAAAGLPVELKMLPVIESALKPDAVSYMGAGGLWQFTHSTGKMHGLKVNTYIDERFDPVKSTKAACQFLKSLYSIYNDWTLALAAYNCGPGNVNKALAKVPNATNFWDIYYHLPMETRGYVPAFMAATYVYAFHQAHGIEFVVPRYPIITDTVVVANQLLHFKQITSTLDQVSIGMLRELNPMYKSDIVPALSEPQHIILPQESISEFIDKQKEIYAKAPIYLSEHTHDSSRNLTRDGYVIHRVRSGEALSIIARKYRVKVSDIMRWNQLKSASKIRAGQKLRIYL